MNKKLLVVLISALFLTTAGYALAGRQGYATERDPYCEDAKYDNEGNLVQQEQAPIAYGRLPIRNGDAGSTIRDVDGPTTGVSQRTCEGEHWDGQDHKSPNFANDKNHPSDPCSGQDVDATQGRYNLAKNQCSDSDDSPINSVDKPIGLRVTAQGTEPAGKLDRGYAYVFLRIFAVGRAGVYTDGCHVLSPQGQSADSQCQSGDKLGRGTLGIYLHDDTFGSIAPGTDLLAGIVSAARITQGYAADEDCTQNEYANSPVTNPTCGRDNTAITIQALA